MSDQERIDRLREAKAKATPGKWTAKVARMFAESEPFGFAITVDGKTNPVAGIGMYDLSSGIVKEEYLARFPEFYSAAEVASNGELIALAHSELDWLLDLASRALLAEQRLAAVTECRDKLAQHEEYYRSRGKLKAATAYAVSRDKLTQALETK